ncbi:hypothetical protein F5Y12DRAFT_742403 [Xylaria sp. FL1777]|nr:hypothetical protein F5Y12DRAFT_742403 [Xylaria sp. FL1777]
MSHIRDPIVSSSNWTPVTTPTHTTTSDTSMDKRYDQPNLHSFTINGGISEVPEPGGLYMIRDLDSGKAITLVEGHVTLVLDAGTRGGWQWKCEELREGWIGFRNVVSGKYLGRDNKGRFVALFDKFHGWESFVLRPREAGGYNLLGKDGYVLRAMAIIDAESTSPTLAETRAAKNGARWEFVKVE